MYTTPDHFYKHFPEGGTKKLYLGLPRLCYPPLPDPSLPMGRRKEIDSVMKKARANSGDYWDKKLLDIEEKDPNRWRHTGFKKMYIEGDSSPEVGPNVVPEHYRGDAPRRNAAPSPPPPGRMRERDRIPPPPRRRSPRSPPRDLRRERGRSPGGPSSRRPPSPPPKVGQTFIHWTDPPK